MLMLVERLQLRLGNHLCGFQVDSSSCFTALSLDETASSDSDNADRADPGHLPRVMRSFLGHVHKYESASHIVTQTNRLRSLFSSTKSTKDRLQTSFRRMQANVEAQVGAFVL